MITTGYFGIPGRTNERAKVHAVDGHQPICGTKMHRDSEYQFCASFIDYRMLECKRCRKIVAEQRAQAEAKALALVKKRDHPVEQMAIELQRVMTPEIGWNPNTVYAANFRRLALYVMTNFKRKRKYGR